MVTNVKVGEVIKAGTVVLLTSGEYSDYEVIGIFRAIKDVIVPGKEAEHRIWRKSDISPDINILSTLLEEIDYSEVWDA